MLYGIWFINIIFLYVAAVCFVYFVFQFTLFLGYYLRSIFSSVGSVRRFICTCLLFVCSLSMAYLVRRSYVLSDTLLYCLMVFCFYHLNLVFE